MNTDSLAVRAEVNAAAWCAVKHNPQTGTTP